MEGDSTQKIKPEWRIREKGARGRWRGRGEGGVEGKRDKEKKPEGRK